MIKHDDSQIDDERVKRAHEYLLLLGNLTTKYTEVRRAPRYPNGERESDVEHSFHLALSAIELAADFYPELDIGLIAQFSLVHDMPEVYAGDVWTFKITPEQRAKKEADEKVATEKLLKQLPPHTAELLERYERQVEPEARFVRFVDKLTPSIINSVNGDAKSFLEDYELKTIEELLDSRDHHSKDLLEKFPEFTHIHPIKDLVFKDTAARMFSGKKYPQQFDK